VGLKWLQISHDTFHERWIASECIRNCVDAAIALGIQSSLVCVKTKTSNGIMDYITKLRLEEHELVEFCEVPCPPVGYAATRIAESDSKVVLASQRITVQCFRSLMSRRYH
jgi:hypothetical protein